MKKIDVSIIIVNHNTSSKIKTLVKSIFKLTKHISFEIILINNTPKDSKILKWKDKYRNILYLENDTKKGFAQNNNIGINKSSGEKVLLLNPDIILKNNSIYHLYKYLKNNSAVGICGAKLLNLDGSLQYSSRRFPTIKSTIIRRTPLRWFIDSNKITKSHLMKEWNHNQNRQVDWVLGACMLIDKELIKSIGMLDENFFLYCEDIDLCYRLKLLGYPTMYVSNAIMYHEHQAESDKKFFSLKTFYHFKGMFYFIWKHKKYLYD